MAKIPATIYSPPMYVPVFKTITTEEIDRAASNPYTVAAIGYSVTIGKFTARLEASREFTDNVNSASLGLTWRPFGH
jgi:hypothetical protein